jgi:hypothetical protein
MTAATAPSRLRAVLSEFGLKGLEPLRYPGLEA